MYDLSRIKRAGLVLKMKPYVDVMWAELGQGSRERSGQEGGDFRLDSLIGIRRFTDFVLLLMAVHSYLINFPKFHHYVKVIKYLPFSNPQEIEQWKGKKSTEIHERKNTVYIKSGIGFIMDSSYLLRSW